MSHPIFNRVIFNLNKFDGFIFDGIVCLACFYSQLLLSNFIRSKHLFVKNLDE